MSLFFDREWFDARLAALGLSKTELGITLGLNERQIEEMWKDQRELKANDVRVLAALLGVEPAEVARRAGVSTPTPPGDGRSVETIMERLTRIETALAELTSEVKALRARRARR